jgi:hypothetical protein
MITLTPAYGRDYKSQKEVKADWLAGKDFIVADFFSPWSGKYANKADLVGQSVTVRYDNKRKAVKVQ